MLKIKENSHVSLLALCVIFSLCSCTQARHHSRTKHKTSHSHKSPKPGSENNHNGTSYFDARTFGGIGDGITDDTEAFKMAWNTACQSQSAVNVIYFPSGFSFFIQSTIFTGPCQGYLVVKVDGTVMPPDGPESWPRNISMLQWLVFFTESTACRLKEEGPHGTTLPGRCDSPATMRFFMSSNLTVKGVRIKNSPQFHFRFDGCINVLIESIHIKAPALSPNTEGIHIENTKDVRIYNSVISNGDDCVSIGSGCFDVDIKNISCGPGHGIRNIRVRESVIKESDHGVRIKTWKGGSGSVFQVTFSNIEMKSVRNLILIDQFYCITEDCSNKSSAVFVSDIVYTNIKGSYDVRSAPMRFECSDSVPCTNIALSGIELLPAEGDEVLDPFCWNADGDSQTPTIPPVT